MQEETVLLEMLRKEVLEEQNNAIEDLFLISNMKETSLLFSNDSEATRIVNSAIFAMIRARDYYDQIRILDAKGMEWVRFDYNDGTPKSIAKEELQDKSDRYYFLNAQDLKPGQVYISPFDLNVEGAAITIPFKPMIRYVMGIYDGTCDVPVGFVVINYLGQRILNKLHEAENSGQENLSLVNGQGYYLYGSDSRMPWGFQLPEHASANLSTLDPKLWARMQEASAGNFSKKSSFQFFTTLEPTDSAMSRIAQLRGGTTEETVLSEQSGQQWFLIKDISKEQWLAQINYLREVFLVNALIGFLVLVILSVMYAKIRMANESMQEQLVREATYDFLTGTYNRNAGFSLLTNLVKLTARNNQISILCFLDLNSLKLVNDRYGHDQGDLFIVSLVEMLKNTLRSTDTIIRLGGDEFLVLAPTCTKEAITPKFEEANELLKSKGKEVGCPVPWTFSFGCIEIPADGSKTADTLIAEADALMYRNKQQMKASLALLASVKDEADR